ncbi:MAG: hypothetical protein LAP85_28535 [Acidobacteriia bacterium]|nr:hypothetical protein [Terriglobia bacterium]
MHEHEAHRDRVSKPLEKGCEITSKTGESATDGATMLWVVTPMYSIH